MPKLRKNKNNGKDEGKRASKNNKAAARDSSILKIQKKITTKKCKIRIKRLSESEINRLLKNNELNFTPPVISSKSSIGLLKNGKMNKKKSAKVKVDIESSQPKTKIKNISEQEQIRRSTRLNSLYLVKSPMKKKDESNPMSKNNVKLSNNEIAEKLKNAKKETIVENSPKKKKLILKKQLKVLVKRNVDAKLRKLKKIEVKDAKEQMNLKQCKPDAKWVSCSKLSNCQKDSSEKQLNSDIFSNNLQKSSSKSEIEEDKKNNLSTKKKQCNNAENKENYLSIIKPSPSVKNDSINMQNKSDIYEFEASQQSASDKEDSLFIRKLAKEGKIVIKNRHKLRNQGKSVPKKKYVPPSNIWNKIKKNIGINSAKLKKVEKTMKNNAAKPFDGNLNLDDINDCGNVSNYSFNNEKKVNDDENVSKYKDSNESRGDNVNEKSVKFQDNEKDKEHTNKSYDNDFRDLNASQKRLNNFFNDSLACPSTPSNQQAKTVNKNKADLLAFAKKVVQKQSLSSTPLNSKMKSTKMDLISPILPLKRKVFGENISKVNVDSTVNILQQKRSPLKQINIIEVRELPPLQFKNKTAGNNILKEIPTTVKFANVTTSINHNQVYSANDSKENYFGFDISETENDDEETVNKTIIPEKAKFKRKLKKLRKLAKPLKNNVDPIKEEEENKIPSVIGEIKSKQTNIREMLTSTLINSSNAESTSIVTDQDFINLSNISEEKSNGGKHDNLTFDLFEDLVGEVNSTLDATKIKKTYTRPKRKVNKRVRYNFFSDKEESGNDDENYSDEGDKNKKRKLAKERKKRKDENFEEELEEFAKKFNSMYEETSKYELITEIDTSGNIA